MKAALHTFWALRSARERTVIAVAGALMVAAIAIWTWHSASRARDVLREKLVKLEADAMRLDRDASEIERLRALPAPAASRSDVRALLESQGNAAGLSRAVTRLDATGADAASITFGAVAFADWLSFLQTLQAHHVRLESARIAALAATGSVSVTATFTREPVQ